MKITNNLGFSLICLNSLTDIEKEFVLNSFEVFDVSITQISLLPPKNILSVQSLFYGTDTSDCSLINDEVSFLNLANKFNKILVKLSSLGLSSVVFGSPNLRKKNSVLTINKEIISQRCVLLNSLAQDVNIKIYYEALPINLCDYLNFHDELKIVSNHLHIDFATMISNGEDASYLIENLKLINRFHISVPGYSYNFQDFPIIIEWTKLLFDNNIPGVIEIQNICENKDLITELKCLIREIGNN